MKALLKKLIGDERLGALDYYRHPQDRNYCSGPFNGQEFRREIFLDLMRNISFSAIVETGTYLGTTTEYLHDASRLPVYTVEQYDGYGEGKVLNLEYLAPVRAQLRLAIFFPARKSGEESGLKRGCVVLAKDPDAVAILRNTGTISEYRE